MKKNKTTNKSLATRQTIQIDDKLYAYAKSNCVETGLKLYQYVNELIAKDLGKKVPRYLYMKPTASTYAKALTKRVCVNKTK